MSINRKFKYIIIAVCVVCLSFEPVEAQTDSLSQYLKMAAQNNPGIKAGLLNYQAALERIPQAGAIPDPQLDISFFLPPMDIIDGSQVADFTFMQMFPWFGTRKAAKTEAEHMAKASYESFRDQRDNLLLEVYTQWYALSDVQQQLIAGRKHKNFLKQLEDLSLRRYASSRTSQGSTDMSEVVRIQLETTQLDSDIESLLSDLEARKAKFNALLNRQAEAPVIIPDSFSQINFELNIPQLLTQIEADNPQLLSFKEENLAYEAKEKADKKMGMPMIGIGLQYSLVKKRMGHVIPVTDMNGMDMVMPMVSLTIPVYRNKYKARQKESRLMQQMSQHQYLDAYNSLKAELYTLNFQLEDARRKIALADQQTNLAQTAYNLLIQDYATGRSELANVIEIQRQMLDYQRKKSEYTAQFNTLVANVLRLISFNNIEPSTIITK